MHVQSRQTQTTDRRPMERNEPTASKDPILHVSSAIVLWAGRKGNGPSYYLQNTIYPGPHTTLYCLSTGKSRYPSGSSSNHNAYAFDFLLLEFRGCLDSLQLESEAFKAPISYSQEYPKPYCYPLHFWARTYALFLVVGSYFPRLTIASSHPPTLK
ncbi:uncharacterized protein BO96DRAFT_410044 [Aspergillus niger CBS 101883]|uniref:uncharacterized protein n=1 Tax=Aspergillus lacticoffeatus (strain CBS 101883) TaxID=1450533 RepID=UPI000D7FF7D0|nr:uncharacterized protein BO96DRAFT_410044 [Aspergillus niger CBS 101883]PYH58782.1 hypothetical protein BO96DRAFT_410044 [Aspergillus niger CBS 101883]